MLSLKAKVVIGAATTFLLVSVVVVAVAVATAGKDKSGVVLNSIIIFFAETSRVWPFEEGLML